MVAATAVKEPEAAAPAVEYFPLRRFVLPDLADKALWLIKRLKERYPAKQDSELLNWLRSNVDNNSSHFVRTDHAVALATVETDALERKTKVMERFVLAESKEHIPEAVSLYTDMKRWAENLGAQEMEVNNLSDVPEDMIKSQTGRIFNRQTAYVRIGK